MKNLFFSRRKMRYILSFFLFVSFSFQLTASCVKQINYRTLDENFHAIEAGVDIGSLNDLDLIRGKSDVKVVDVSICIDINGFITKEMIFTLQENTHYPSAIRRVVFDVNGIRSYDINEEIINDIPHDPTEIDNLPGIGIALSPTEIDNYAAEVDFPGIVDYYETYFSEFEGSSWQSGGKDYFSSSKQDVVVSSADQYFLSSNYDEYGDIESVEIKTFQSNGNFILPQYEINHSYSNLSEGSILQSTSQKTYLDYSVLADEEYLVQFNNESHPYYSSIPDKTSTSSTNFNSFSIPSRLKPDFEVHPNPASHQITINTKTLFKGKDFDWTIQNSQAMVLKNGHFPKGESTLTIDIQEIPAGMYFINISQENNSFSKKFIVIK